MGGSFNGFLKPKPDQRSNGKKYGTGDTINIKDLSLSTFPVESFLGVSNSYNLTDVQFEGEFMFYTLYYNYNVYLTKCLKSVNFRGNETYTQVLQKTFNVTKGNNPVVVLFPDSEFLYLSAGNSVIKAKKTDLTEVTRYTAGDTVQDIILSKDKTYLSVLYNDSSNGTSISLRKLNLNLGVISEMTSLPSWNFSAVFLNESFLYCYGYYAGSNCIIDTTTMTRYDINAMFADNTDHMSRKRIICEDGYLYYFQPANGRIYKILLDEGAKTCSVVTYNTFYSSNYAYTFFSYNKENFFMYQVSNPDNRQNVLIDKRTLLNVTYCQQIFGESPDNYASFAYYNKQLNEFLYRTQAQGTVYKTSLNCKIK